MHVAIDLRWMIPGLAGGIENVARAFIHELCQLDNLNHYTLLVNPRCLADFKQIKKPNITIKTQNNLEKLKKRSRLLAGRLLSKLHLAHLFTPTLSDLRFVHQLNADLIYSIPGYIRPEFYSLTNILTVHDIQHEFFPQFFTPHQLEERKIIYKQSIDAAKHITAVSEFTRQTLIEKLNIDSKKITTILQAADPYFSAEHNPLDLTILQKYHLQSQSFLFFPAHTWYHKNHIAAIQALAILKKKYGYKPTLICTGGKREAQLLIEKTIQHLGLHKQVHFLGYIERAHVPALYRGAIALLYPSLFEGFGLPVLEAMNSGCPVICSNTSSLPEIAGNAACLIDPHNYEAIADALYQIIHSADLREHFKTQGLQQAKKFSWTHYTQQKITLFTKIHAEIRGEA